MTPGTQATIRAYEEGNASARQNLESYGPFLKKKLAEHESHLGDLRRNG